MLGQKTTALAAVVLMACVSALTILVSNKGVLFATFPVYGGLTAILLVNMNVMSQGVQAGLRNFSNTLYRSTFIGFSIVGPLSAGFLIEMGYFAAFIGFALVLLVSIGALYIYPQDTVPAKPESVGKSAARIIGSWRSLFRDKSLLTFMIMTGLLNHIIMVNSVLVPIKLLNQLSVSGKDYTWIMTISSITGLLLTIIVGFFIRKYLPWLIAVPLLLSSACNLLTGLQEQIWLTAGLFVMSTALYTITMAPSSLWLSGMTRGTFGTVFSLFKIFSAGLGFIVSVLLSFVQPLLGLDLSLLSYGVVGVLLSILFMRQLAGWKRRMKELSRESVPCAD